MKLFSLKTLTVITTFLSLLKVPSAAQQEINPDHFDEKPSAAKYQKTAAAAHKPDPTKKAQKVVGQSARVSKNKNEQAASLVTEARNTVR